MVDSGQPSDLPGVVERFLRYVQIDTQSTREGSSTPSTEKQKDLSRLLARELRELGLEGTEMDDYGYVYASLPATNDPAESKKAPAIGLLAHVDTSPDAPGSNVRPQIHRNYDGGAVALPGDPTVTLDPARSPALLDHIGHDLITSDGTTLLGSDDKAGVAIIVQTLAELIAEPKAPRPEIRVCFTVDEEIGKGVDHLDRERFGADVAYTVDGGPVGDLDTETFHAAEAQIVVRGVNVHPGTAKEVMANALTILAQLLERLPRSEAPENTQGCEGYFCPYEMAGNVASSTAKVLLRDFEVAGLERRKATVRAAVELSKLEHPRARIELSIEDNYRNMKSYIEQRDPRAIDFALAAGRELGLEMNTQRVRGGTDGARLSELGLPTPNLFTGGHDYHSCFEWNTVQNLRTSVAYLKRLLGYWAEHGAQ